MDAEAFIEKYLLQEITLQIGYNRNRFVPRLHPFLHEADALEKLYSCFLKICEGNCVIQMAKHICF
ncbi:Uncharacterised protein [Mycobacteroides abscessus subsp. abscessus]|nr:Uncharacterised protein [Mycobacteroides abscessus subsp. abscessus]